MEGLGGLTIIRLKHTCARADTIKFCEIKQTVPTICLQVHVLLERCSLSVVTMRSIIVFSPNSRLLDSKGLNIYVGYNFLTNFSITFGAEDVERYSALLGH